MYKQGLYMYKQGVSAYHFATSPQKIDVPYITQSNFLVVYYLIAEGNGS